MNVSKRRTSPSVWCTFGSCRNLPAKSECLCCNEIGVVAGNTNESTIMKSVLDSFGMN